MAVVLFFSRSSPYSLYNISNTLATHHTQNLNLLSSVSMTKKQDESTHLSLLMYTDKSVFTIASVLAIASNRVCSWNELNARMIHTRLSLIWYLFSGNSQKGNDTHCWLSLELYHVYTNTYVILFLEAKMFDFLFFWLLPKGH